MAKPNFLGLTLHNVFVVQGFSNPIWTVRIKLSGLYGARIELCHADYFFWILRPELNCPSSELSKFRTVQVPNCPSSELSKFNCPSLTVQVELSLSHCCSNWTEGRRTFLVELSLLNDSDLGYTSCTVLVEMSESNCLWRFLQAQFRKQSSDSEFLPAFGFHLKM
jgi:hypothetical protein